MEVNRLKAAVEEGFQTLESDASQVGIKLKKLQQQNHLVESAEMNALAEKEKLVKQLAALSTRKDQAEGNVKTLLEFQEIERAFFQQGSDPDLDMETGIQKAGRELTSIEIEMKAVKQQEDAQNEKLKKGAYLRGRLASEMDSARSSLSLKKEEQSARIASYLELTSQLDASVPHLEALKNESGRLEKEWLSKLMN